MKAMLVSGISVVILSLFPGWTAAERLNRGTVELGVSGSHLGASVSADGEEVETRSVSSLSGELGYFLSPIVEIQGGIALYRESAKLVIEVPLDPRYTLEVSSHSVGLSGSVVFNIPTSGALLPFFTVGGGLVVYGGDYSGDESSYVFPSLAGGVRAFLSPSVSVNFQAGFQHQKNWGGREDLNRNAFILAVGLSGFLGRE